MHRLMTALLVGFIGLAACATPSQNVADTTEVERLRLRITKVRNAIDETRETIAQSRGATYLPELYVRLAELLSEEARYHYQLAYEREQRQSRVLHVPQVRLLKEEAIDIYETGLSRFPDSELAPRMLFNVGHEHRELGNFDDMITALERLIETYQDSPLRYDALLVLGDYYFDQQDIDKARTYYEDIITGPIAPSTGLGHYKLAWVWVNMAECDKALQHFELAIDKSNEWEDIRIAVARSKRAISEDDEGSQIDTSDLPRSQEAAQQEIDVRRESLVDLAYCYAREKKEKDAIEYFRARAYNRATYVAGLAKLLNRYRNLDNHNGVILVGRELLNLGPADADRIDDARALFAAIDKKERYEAVDDDVAAIASALTRYYSRVDVTPQNREELVKEFELYLRDIATSAQTKMKALEGLDKKRAAERLGRAYRTYVETFPDAEARPDMLLNMADVLTQAGDPLEAGLRALEAATLVEKDRRKDALYDAIVHFQESLTDIGGRRQFERVTARASLRRAAAMLLAFDLDEDKERRVKFAVAQSYYDEGNYDAAIDRLSALAYEYPKTDEADAAIQLVLDSYNTINDYDGLIFASRRFLAEDTPASPDQQERTKGVLAAAEQRKLDEVSLSAAGEDGGDLTELVKFAERHKGRKLGERALLNAFVAARAVGDTKQMYQLADELEKVYPKSDQLPGVYSTLAQTATARFEYDEAVRFLRRAAKVNPEQRVGLLIAAGDLLEQLGAQKEALAVYADAVEGSDGLARTEALRSFAAMLERAGDADELRKELEPYIQQADPETLARYGIVVVGDGDVEEGEMLLSRALSEETSDSVETLARANYGNAEVLLGTLQKYPDPDSVELIEEVIAIIDVTQQSYLKAARTGHPEYAAASLARLAYALEVSARKLEKVTLPADLDPAGQKAVRDALDAKIATLRKTAKEAVEGCAAQLWNLRILTPVVKACVQGKPLTTVLPPSDDLKSRKSKSTPNAKEDLLESLSKNPEDVEGLLTLGESFLEGGDPHAARLVFARAAGLAGEAKVYNLLGIASYRIGDVNGAFAAFVQSAEGGLEAGRQNLKALLEKEGLTGQAAEVEKKFKQGKPGGRLM